ncbi:MAG: hypothetical protein ACR2P8_14430 [Myxococcota bacterium]
MSIPRGLIAFIGFLAIGVSTPQLAQAQDINWVEFPTWSTGDTSGSGTSTELAVDAAFSNIVGPLFPGTPAYDTSTEITNPDWPFSTTQVPLLVIRGTGTLSYSHTFDYTNAGGLPAGGSVVVTDLEDPGSTVTLVGLVGGMEVPVSWQVGFIEASGLPAQFPTWNPATATLTGATTVHEPRTNLAFLVSDQQLDAVRFDVVATNADGIGYNSAAQTVISSVPVPALGVGGSAVLAGLLAVSAIGVHRVRPATASGRPASTAR